MADYTTTPDRANLLGLCDPFMAAAARFSAGGTGSTKSKRG
jgi:hypothetical protein